MGGTYDEASSGGLSAEYVVFRGGWNGGGLLVGACTLLGPEGPGFMPSGSSGLILSPVLLVGGVGAARTLRTTQWTRAS